MLSWRQSAQKTPRETTLYPHNLVMVSPKSQWECELFNVHISQLIIFSDLICSLKICICNVNKFEENNSFISLLQIWKQMKSRQEDINAVQNINASTLTAKLRTLTWISCYMDLTNLSPALKKYIQSQTVMRQPKVSPDCFCQESYKYKAN